LLEKAILPVALIGLKSLQLTRERNLRENALFLSGRLRLGAVTIGKTACAYLLRVCTPWPLQVSVTVPIRIGTPPA